MNTEHPGKKILDMCLDAIVHTKGKGKPLRLPVEAIQHVLDYVVSLEIAMSSAKAEEREICAEIADSHRASTVAYAIRARGKKA